MAGVRLSTLPAGTAYSVPHGALLSFPLSSRPAQAPTHTTQVTHQHLHLYDAQGKQVDEAERRVVVTR